MKKLIGSPGTVSGLLLRVGQCGFAAASIAIMVSSGGFSSYTAFCYLIASMGLQLLWSLGLACLDMYALRRKRDLHNPVLVSLFVVGDWLGKKNVEPMDHILSEKVYGSLILFLLVTGMLSLAAACSSAGVIILYARDLHFCKAQATLPCHRFEISVILAFVTWFLIGISSHVMFWILASV